MSAAKISIEWSLVDANGPGQEVRSMSMELFKRTGEQAPDLVHRLLKKELEGVKKDMKVPFETRRSSSPLVSFLYQLMRDELVVGEVQRLVNESVLAKGDEVVFTNGPLADIAEHFARELA